MFVVLELLFGKVILVFVMFVTFADCRDVLSCFSFPSLTCDNCDILHQRSSPSSGPLN